MIILYPTDLLIKNTSLEIRSARREDQGFYHCIASNLEGKTDSNEVVLDIHCKSYYRCKDFTDVLMIYVSMIETDIRIV